MGDSKPARRPEGNMAAKNSQKNQIKLAKLTKQVEEKDLTLPQW